MSHLPWTAADSAEMDRLWAAYVAARGSPDEARASLAYRAKVAQWEAVCAAREEHLRGERRPRSGP